jgi:hypothetical protein
MAKTTAGQELKAQILDYLDGEKLDPDGCELKMLDRAAAAADRIAELEAIVAVKGSTFVDKNGLTRPTPLLAEIRAQDAVLARALSNVGMFVPEKSAGGKQAAKQRAGQASWRARKARYGVKQVGSP